MKVSIIGIGHVGSTIAFAMVTKELCDELVLVNRTRRTAEGEAADLRHASAFVSRTMSIEAGEIADTANTDLLIVCVSTPMDRALTQRREMAPANASLFRDIIPSLAGHSPAAVLLIVTNPVDVMTYLAWQLSGLPASQVIGTGTLIDSARFRSNLSGHLGIHPEDIRAYVLGEHGDSQFPLLSIAAAGGERLGHDPAIARLFDTTASSAQEIVAVKGYTNYAIALATCMIAESVLQDSHRTLPVSTVLQGYQGQYDVCLSVPAVIGRCGVVRQLNPQFDADEIARLGFCADEVRQVIRSVQDPV